MACSAPLYLSLLLLDWYCGIVWPKCFVCYWSLLQPKEVPNFFLRSSFTDPVVDFAGLDVEENANFHLSKVQWWALVAVLLFFKQMDSCGFWWPSGQWWMVWSSLEDLCSTSELMNIQYLSTEWWGRPQLLLYWQAVFVCLCSCFQAQATCPDSSQSSFRSLPSTLLICRHGLCCFFHFPRFDYWKYSWMKCMLLTRLFSPGLQLDHSIRMSGQLL